MNIVSYWTWWFSQCRHWGWPRSGEHGEHQRVLLGYQYLFQWTPNIFTSLLDMITQIYIHSFTITTVYNSLSCIHSFILIIQPSYNIHIANNHDNVYIHISIFIFIYIYHSLYIYIWLPLSVAHRSLPFSFGFRDDSPGWESWERNKHVDWVTPTQPKLMSYVPIL